MVLGTQCVLSKYLYSEHLVTVLLYKHCVLGVEVF